MEKLQELFTEWVNNTLWATKKHFYDKFEVEQNLNRLDMLKQFVQFLVENDKIDNQKFREKAKFLILSNSIEYYEVLIMELSIQKKPIKFLISVLK